jgi:hypothetical protein
MNSDVTDASLIRYTMGDYGLHSTCNSTQSVSFAFHLSKNMLVFGHI